MIIKKKITDTFDDGFASRNICDDETLTELVKISYTGIQVGLQ